MHRSRRSWLVAALALAGCAHQRSGGGELSVFVVSKRQPASLYRLDPLRGTITGRTSLGVNGHEVAVSVDGRLAYVPIYGDGAVGRPGTDGSTIEVIDARTLRRVDVIDLGAGVRPHSLVERDGLIWVTAEKAQAVLIVDPRTSRVVGRVPTGQPESHALVFSPDGRRAYTANVGAGTVSVIDAVARRLEAVIPVARRIQRVTVSPDGRHLFTHDTDAPRLAVIDTATNMLARWIELPDASYASVVTPDGRSLLVLSPVRRRVHVVDLATLTVVRTVDPDCDPAFAAVSGGAAYLSCPRDGKVAVLDLPSLTMRPAIPVEPGIEGLAVAP
jgi:YVTN family beta-propeller protein